MAVEFKDYYRILGVDRSADDKTIKSAFRKLARKHHPDVAKTKDAGARFREISEAYEVLSDPEKRRRYDTLGPDWQRYAQPGAGPQPGGTRVEYGDAGDFSDFFRTIFGDLGGREPAGGGTVDLEDLLGGFRRGAPRASRGQDVQTNVTISLEAAFRGTRKAFELEIADDNVTDPAVPGRLVTFQTSVKIVREQIWEELALVPAIDWVRPPQPRDYIPFTRDQIITGSQHYEAVIGNGADREFVLDHGLNTEALHVTLRENSSSGRKLRDSEFSVTFGGANSLHILFPENLPPPAAVGGHPTSSRPTPTPMPGSRRLRPG